MPLSRSSLTLYFQFPFLSAVVIPFSFPSTNILIVALGSDVPVIVGLDSSFSIVSISISSYSLIYSPTVIFVFLPDLLMERVTSPNSASSPALTFISDHKIVPVLPETLLLTVKYAIDGLSLSISTSTLPSYFPVPVTVPSSVKIKLL